MIVLTNYARFNVLLLDVKCPSLSNEMELIFFSINYFSENIITI